MPTAPLTHRLSESYYFLGVFSLLFRSVRCFGLVFLFPRLRFRCLCSWLWACVRGFALGAWLGSCFGCFVVGFVVVALGLPWSLCFVCACLSSVVGVVWSSSSFLCSLGWFSALPAVVSARSGAVLLFWFRS